MFVLPMPYKSKSALPILSGFLLVQLAAGLLLLTCIGCDEETRASAKAEPPPKPQVSGIVKSITPLPNDLSSDRIVILVEFEDGRVANLNYYATQDVFIIHKGKYNIIFYDNNCDITEVQQIQAEIDFP